MNKLSFDSPHIPKAATLTAAILLGLSGAKAVNLRLQDDNPPLTEKPGSLTQRKTGPVNKTADYRKLANFHIMGKVDKEAKSSPTVQKIIHAPETRLKLKLLGVVFNGDTDDGIAIISENLKTQKTFHKNDKVFGNATLYAIEPNRVILKRNGRHETLTLVKPDLNTKRPPSAGGERSATTTRPLVKTRNSATKSTLIKPIKALPKVNSTI